ncbi:hypothetical protein WOLCODRAFT_17498 [Wolfiporia cocos MD-104 SS10]|uniref:Pali-domain-containing protein n=1 Tax=Wolfiporia cocos (strain MD-104) TaxID=742152 RepID=A0A2H3K131_WOLCO|nr:hypothetical protein WOLCODRAFT_17498 [Wolfiporia cocos MD-104 SS10]
MSTYAFAVLLGTFSAFGLLVLVTVSAPLVRMFYFLKVTTDSEEIRFGMWGYCADTCSAIRLGYTYGTEIPASLSTALILSPVSAGASLLALLAVLPLVYSTRIHKGPYLILSLLSFVAASLSVAAFIVMAYAAAVGITRFQAEGHSAGLGPTLWLLLWRTCGETVLISAR